MSATVKYQVGLTYNRTNNIRLVPALNVAFNTTDNYAIREAVAAVIPVAVSLGGLSEDERLVYFRNPSTTKTVIVSTDALGADIIAAIPAGQIGMNWLPVGESIWVSVAAGTQAIDYAAVEIDPPAAP